MLMPILVLKHQKARPKNPPCWICSIQTEPGTRQNLTKCIKE
jgi:hypothetical protein